MIRVLHYGIDSKLGGIETYLNKLYTNIDRDKFKFDFIYIGDEEPCYYNEFKDMGSNFYNITPRSKNLIKHKRELRKLFKENNFDIIHCHLNTLSYIEPIIAAIENNIPVIVHSRNAGTSKSKVSNLLHKINSYRIPKNKLTKLAVSDLAGDWLFGKDENYMVINNGLNIEKYKFDDNVRKRVRSEFGFKDELVIIHLGALREQKNHMFILEIFKEVLKEEPKSKLLLVGDGHLKDSINSRINELNIENSVIMAGERNDVRDILCSGDIFLFPSFFEGFPNAVLEAQATGLPCFISDIITKEVMVNEDCYSISLKKSAKEWAEQILIKRNNIKNRYNSSKEVKKKGFAVEEEIKRVSDIYINLFNEQKKMRIKENE